MTEPKREKDWADKMAEGCLPAHKHLQGTVAAAIRATKDHWLEEAAKVCDFRLGDDTRIARDIRALKGNGG